jgi:iron complex outermembrane receptor protein
MRPGLVVPFALAAILAAHAQEPEPKDAEGPPVVVESERFPDPRTATDEEAAAELRRDPGGTVHVDSTEMDRSRGATLEDVLRMAPGLMIRPRLGSASDEPQLSVRGSGLRSNFHGRGINLLINGFPHGNADGFSDFESFEMKLVKRIEVYKGIAALRWGANTLGGAINMITKTGKDLEDHLEAGADFGSFDYFKTYAIAGGDFDGVDVLAYGSRTYAKGYRHHAQMGRTRAGTSLGLELGGGASLRFDFAYTRSDQKLPGSLTEEEFEDDARQAAESSVLFDEARDFDDSRARTILRLPLGTTFVLEWATHFGFQELDHPLSFAVIDDDTYNWGTELRGTLEAPLGTMNNRLVAGLQYSATRQNENFYLSNVGGHHDSDTMANRMNESWNVAAYAEDSLDPVESLTLVLGARYGYSSRTTDDRKRNDGPFDTDPDDSDGVRFHPLSARAGAIVRPAKDVEIFANIGRGYEAPVLFESAAPGNLAGDFDDLRPQRAWQYEIGTRGSVLDGRISWDLSLYDIELHDEIRNANVAPFPGATFTIPRYENIRRSRHSGVEFGAEVVVFRGLLADGGDKPEEADSLTVSASYTWSRFKYVNDPAFDDNNLPGAPRHYVTAEVRYEHPCGFWIAPGFESTPSGYYADSANELTTNHYSLFHLKAGYEYKPWKLEAFVEVRNIADKDHMSAVVVDSDSGAFVEPGDGRAFYGGVQWKW